MSSSSGDAAVWDTPRLRMATQAAGVALWSWNVDTDEIALDEKALILWGVAQETAPITFAVLSTRIHPQDLDRVRAAFTATRQVAGGYEIDFRILIGGSVRWISARGRGQDEGIVGREMFGVFLDVSERKLAEEAREMLVGEMSHRVKNLFSTAAALTNIALRSTSSADELAADLRVRLTALAHAHQLVRPVLGDQRRAVELSDLLASLLSAYESVGVNGHRIRINVPDVLVGESSISTLALVVHELATNSLKYGALSRHTGTLDVACTVDDEAVLFVWTETGGPAVSKPPIASGFGSKLVENIITRQLSGSIAIEWLQKGIVVRLRMNQARLGV